ncbi:MAG: hypothetical protein IPK22_05275 [Verrucomicrobiaceae bacterium]|nr:hypothetical protein [Verrucomicrobiaceae bacterium]
MMAWTLNQFKPEDWPAYSWLVIIGVAIGWFIENRRKSTETTKLRNESAKLKTEVSKLETEQVKLAGDTLRELQRARDAYADACVVCTKCVQDILSAIGSTDPSAVTKARNAFCEALTRGAIHTYCALIEWECLSRKLTPDKLRSYILNDVIAELSKLTEWVLVINSDMFRTGYQSSPLVISEQTLRPIIDCDRFLPDEEAASVRQSLRAATNKLQAA